MKFIKFNFLACLGLLATLCGMPEKSEAIIASVKSTGMGQAAIAYPQDSLAVAFNPAAMIAVGRRVDGEIYWAHDRGRATVSNNKFPIPPPPFPQINGTFNVMRTHDVYGANFGFNTCFCSQLGCWNFEWSFGSALYNRDFQKTTFNKIQPLFGTSKPGIEALHEEIDTSLAIRIWDGHTLGVSVDWHIFRVKVNGLQNFDNPMFSSHPGHVTNRGYNYSQGVGVTVGYYGQLCDWLAIGATYRPKTRMKRFTKYDGFFAQHGRIDIPEKIGAGIAFTFSPCWALAFDYEHFRWHQIKALSNKILPAILTELLGTDEGVGFGWRNQNKYRVGINYFLNDCLTIRAGFVHVQTPTPRSQLATNVLLDDLVQDYLTVGFTWYFSCCMEFSGFFAHGFKHTLKKKGAIPVPIFGGGDIKLNESKNALGFALGWCW